MGERGVVDGGRREVKRWRVAKKKGASISPLAPRLLFAAHIAHMDDIAPHHIFAPPLFFCIFALCGILHRAAAVISTARMFLRIGDNGLGGVYNRHGAKRRRREWRVTPVEQLLRDA